MQGKINIYLPVAEQGVIGFNPGIHDGYNFETNHPVVVLLNRPSEELNIPEDVFTTIRAARFMVHTKVGSIFPTFPDDNIPDPGELTEIIKQIFNSPDGLKKLVLQNELTVLPEGKAFDPFTAMPEPGRSFYIGSDEIFNKPVNELAVFIKKTDDYSASKKGTRFQAIANPVFLKKDKTGANDRINIEATSTNPLTDEYAVSVLDNRNWVELKSKLPLSGPDFSRLDLMFNILNKAGRADNTSQVIIPVELKRGSLVSVTEWKPGMERGFLRLDNLIEITGDGNHSNLSLNLAHELEIKEVSVSYYSKLGLEAGVDQVFHVYPFGVAEIVIDDNKAASLNVKAGKRIASRNVVKNELAVYSENKLLPQFTFPPTIADAVFVRDLLAPGIRNSNEQIIVTPRIPNQYAGDLQQEGMLFIGLENAEPLQNVSLLFQFAEGSAADEDNTAPGINWSYLVYNEWRSLPSQNLVSDGTYGLLTTGIVNIAIPADANTRHTIISDGLTWICASVKEHSERIPMLINIVTQAVEAQFDDRENASSHFDLALPAGSIKKLVAAVSQISKVEQPFASFDGKHREIGKEFYTRVSERLRHKHRAITAWDYEHLVLDRFPSIYKVKCITHNDPDCLCRTPLKVSISKNLSESVIRKIPLQLTDFKKPAEVTALKNLLDPVINSPSAKNNVVFLLIGFYNESIGDSRAVSNKTMKQYVQFVKSLSVTADRILVDMIADTQTDRVLFWVVKKDLMETELKGNCCGPQVAPGHVLLVPIPNLKNRNAVNPLQPKTARRTLLEIESYLAKYTSPFVKVHAKNPVYEQVLVSFKVKFYSGTDGGFYLKKLNDDIVHFLTPWAFDENAEVKFGQKIYASSVINFIEERNYVDFVTDFVMKICRIQCCDDAPKPADSIGTSSEDEYNKWLDSVMGCCGMEPAEDDAIEGEVIAKPSTARSILVSVAQHQISLYVEPPRLTPCEKIALAKSADPRVSSTKAATIADNIVSEKDEEAGKEDKRKAIADKIESVKETTKKRTGGKRKGK